MPLSFPNVSVLGLTQDSRFFDAGFQYASFRRLTIAGTVNDLSETFGITGTWSGEEGVLNTIRNNHDYQALILNGVDFGSGRVESMSFDPGLDVKTKGYQANIVVYDSGNLFNFTGEYYSGIETSNFSNLNQFSESYSFDKKLNGGYSYSHNAAIQFISGSNQLFAIGAAQSLARTLFTGSNLGFAFYPGFTNKQGKRYVTESYNLIDNTCAFQETFDFDNNLGAYSATYTHSIQLGEDGVMTASENGNIRGIENPNYQIALSAVAVEMTGSYYRCSGVANAYFPTGAILITSPVSQGRSIDIFNNNINYNVVFNNSPTNQRSYFWDYSLQAAKNNGISTVTEQGSVVGRGENESVAFDNARAGFSVVKPGIEGRCGSLFVSPYEPATNYLENKNESYSPVRGQVGYSYVYSNDPNLRANDGVRRLDLSVTQNHPVYSWNKIGIFNVATILQNDYQSTQGSQTATAVMEGDKTVGYSSMVGLGEATVNSNAPVGSDTYITDTSYSYNLNKNSTSVSKTWLYNRSASRSNYPS
jgi:hypothetical protein